MRVFKIGDIFVSRQRGVITIIDKLSDHLFLCKVYDKEEVRDSNKSYTTENLDLFVDFNIYNFYPVKE
jgi:hypothetical protein